MIKNKNGYVILVKVSMLPGAQAAEKRLMDELGNIHAMFPSETHAVRLWDSMYVFKDEDLQELSNLFYYLSGFMHAVSTEETFNETTPEVVFAKPREES